jgi:ABC-type uncharacterized transport system substrate-binding protein
MGTILMKRVMVFVFCLSYFFTLSPNASGAGKVLLVHSYHAGYLWTDDITRGIKRGLAGSRAELKIFHMDTKRNPGEAWKIKAGKLAKKRVAETRPNVVITADENAQAYFAKDYVGQAYPQIVFCGVNAEASKYGYPASNVTGILERPYFVQSFDMLKVIVPDVEKVAVITDAGPTSDQIIAQMKSKSLPIKVASIDQPGTYPEWQEHIRRYQRSVDAICVILYHTLLSETFGGKTVPPKEVMAWTLANNQKPLFSVAPFAVEDGAIFGVVNSAFEQGMEAARIAREILKGRKAGEFPIVKPKKGAVYINIRTAEKMGFEIPFGVIRATDRILE